MNFLRPDNLDDASVPEEEANQWNVREGVIYHRMAAVHAKVSPVTLKSPTLA